MKQSHITWSLVGLFLVLFVAYWFSGDGTIGWALIFLTGILYGRLTVPDRRRELRARAERDEAQQAAAAAAEALHRRVIHGPWPRPSSSERIALDAALRAGWLPRTPLPEGAQADEYAGFLRQRVAQRIHGFLGVSEPARDGAEAAST